MQRPKAEDAWNVYDYTLVTLSVADVVVSITVPGSGGLGIAKMLRICRLLRIYRSVKGLKALAGLWVITQGFLDSLLAVVWISFALFLFLFMFAVIVTTMVPVDRLLLFSGKRYLHCTEPWFGRRVVLVAYTVMGSISIPPELEEKLQALGIPTPDSLSAEYYFHNPVGPGQPEQTRLPFLPEKKTKVWKAGQLSHEWVGCLNVDSLESENHDIDISEVSNTVQDSVFSIHDSESQDS
eukprot:s2078_g6.t1